MLLAEHDDLVSSAEGLTADVYELGNLLKLVRLVADRRQFRIVAAHDYKKRSLLPLVHVLELGHVADSIGHRIVLTQHVVADFFLKRCGEQN